MLFLLTSVMGFFIFHGSSQFFIKKMSEKAYDTLKKFKSI